jgi:hypothetical protein
MDQRELNIIMAQVAAEGSAVTGSLEVVKVEMVFQVELVEDQLKVQVVMEDQV